MSHQTIFGDLRQRAIAVYRVKTVSSVYIVGVHERRGRKFVIVRGAPGTDREHVVVRDSDPRVGDRSMFELPVAEWPGRTLEVAMMTTSTIESVVAESDPAAIAAVAADGKVERSPWARPGAEPGAASGAAVALPPPGGMSSSPAIVPMNARGTSPAADPIGREAAAEGAQRHQLAKQVVVGQRPVAAQPAPADVPYPQRHVTYAESVVQLLRSISRRDQLFEDLGANRELRDRLRRALDESATLLEQIRRRDRK
ncbi:MAG TPA: hypothetical protein VK932_21905 [Kofleriaceae bacterium]|nr:hypothetical protein [Kofleriaceae bacterium]